MRGQNPLSKTSVSAIKWSFVKKFDSTAQCFKHLEQHNVSLDTEDFTQKKLAVWFGSENTG